MPKGFFSVEETSVSVPEEKKVAGCGWCKLKNTCKTPCMEPDGKGKRRILIVGEAPGENEDRRGKPFIGQAGRKLEEELDKADISLRDDCLITNAVRCRPPENQTPKKPQIESCRPLLWKTIRELQPKVILAFGGSAVDALWGHRAGTAMEITKWRGWTIPDKEGSGAWVYPTFHPSFLTRKSKYQEVANVLFEHDIVTAIDKLKHPVPDVPNQDSIIYDEETARIEAERLLQNLDSGPMLVTVDFETNMLKPHSQHSDLVTAGFAWDGGCFALKYAGNTRLIRQILAHENCYLVAAKMKMERDWTYFYVGLDTPRWVWDVCLAAHVLDHRQGTANVKFRALVNLGVEQYNSSIEFKSDHGYEDNGIHKHHIDDILKYNGVDALVEHELALQQMDKLGFTYEEVLELERSI